MKILIKNGSILTMNAARDIIDGDLLIEDDRIMKIGSFEQGEVDETFEADSYVILPGFVQAHIHLCQTLFRNMADDLSLLEWLQKKIWPMESRHTPDSLRVSARLGLAELIKSGTTTILDMGTVHHQDEIFKEMARLGIRGFSGKAMMDDGDIPPGLREETSETLRDSHSLFNTWHGYDGGRLGYAYAPRFALSCSEKLMRETAQMAKDGGALYHSHAAENEQETELVRNKFGSGNIELFERFGATETRLCLAHCIWTSEQEREIMKHHNINVLHCPSANLKLASGIAPIPDYHFRDILVALGSDGPPCNNNLDMFREMRLAALIQKPLHGAQAMPAEKVLAMATIEGARALGLDTQIGSIEIGKKADMIFIEKNQVHAIPFDNMYAKLVYSTQASDVRHVLLNGKWLYKDGSLTVEDEEQLKTDALIQLKQILVN